MKSRIPVLTLTIGALTLVAFALRVWGLDGLGDLDFDEQASSFIGSMAPADMIAYLLRAPFEHPPGFYLLLHAWMALTGPSETAMRMLSVLLGTLTVPVVALAAGRVGGGRAAVVAGGFLAVAPLHVFYSRDARMYPLVAFLMAMALLALAWRTPSLSSAAHREAMGTATPSRPDALSGESSRWRVAGWGAAALALATHYFAALALVGMAIGAVTNQYLARTRAVAPGGLETTGWQTMPRRFVLPLLAAVAALLAIAFWVMLAPGLQTTLSVAYPRPVDMGRLLGALVESMGAALAGPLAGPAQNALAACAVAGALLLAFLGWRRIRTHAGPASVWLVAVGGFVAVTLGVPLLLILGREFAPRFVVIGMPFLAVALGIGAAQVSARSAALGGVVVAGLSLVGIAPYYGYVRSDYGRAMAELRGQIREGDAVVLNGPWQDILYRRYGQGLPAGVFIASTVPLKEEEAIGNLQRLAAQHPRIWVVDSATDAADPTGVATRWLDTHAYPRPVIEYRKAVLRPYLTDAGWLASFAMRPVDAELLGLRAESVSLDRWEVAPGAEARMRIALRDGCRGVGPSSCAAEERRLAAELLDPAGQSIWHWDGPLNVADNRLEYRAAVVPPETTPSGAYALRATVYARDDAGKVARISEPATLATLRITPR